MTANSYTTPTSNEAPLPRREPMQSFAEWGAPPARVSRTEPGERAWVSPGRPPWDSQVHQNLAVQHGWPNPGQLYPSRPASNAAIWALVTGCVGIVVGWLLLGLPSLAAVILGHIALSKTRDDRMTGRGMAVAGLVLGYIMLAAMTIAFLLYASTV